MAKHLIGITILLMTVFGVYFFARRDRDMKHDSLSLIALRSEIAMSLIGTNAVFFSAAAKNQSHPYLKKCLIHGRCDSTDWRSVTIFASDSQQVMVGPESAPAFYNSDLITCNPKLSECTYKAFAEFRPASSGLVFRVTLYNQKSLRYTKFTVNVPDEVRPRPENCKKPGWETANVTKDGVRICRTNATMQVLKCLSFGGYIQHGKCMIQPWPMQATEPEILKAKVDFSV